jgi:hypothetical protein
VNSAEGFFSIFKRGMVGVYQHCDERHLHATLPNSISAIATESRLGLMMRSAPIRRFAAQSASG